MSIKNILRDRSRASLSHCLIIMKYYCVTPPTTKRLPTITQSPRSTPGSVWTTWCRVSNAVREAHGVSDLRSSFALRTSIQHRLPGLVWESNRDGRVTDLIVSPCFNKHSNYSYELRTTSTVARLRAIIVWISQSDLAKPLIVFTHSCHLMYEKVKHTTMEGCINLSKW